VSVCACVCTRGPRRGPRLHFTNMGTLSCPYVCVEAGTFGARLSAGGAPKGPPRIRTPAHAYACTRLIVHTHVPNGGAPSVGRGAAADSEGKERIISYEQNYGSTELECLAAV
jgi:hypothetical protein